MRRSSRVLNLCLLSCLRLLAVLIRQVGRASANVQRSNISLGIGDQQFFDQSSSPVSVVDSPAASGDEGVDGTAKDLKEAETSLPKETPLLLRGMRLRRDEPGRAAAHRDMSVRHSMSMWVSALFPFSNRRGGPPRLYHGRRYKYAFAVSFLFKSCSSAQVVYSCQNSLTITVGALNIHTKEHQGNDAESNRRQTATIRLRFVVVA